MVLPVSTDGAGSHRGRVEPVGGCRHVDYRLLAAGTSFRAGRADAAEGQERASATGVPTHFAEKPHYPRMTDADDRALSTAEFVDYCRTQARFLSGSIQTMGEEADALLDEIGQEMAEIRQQLDDEDGSVDHTSSPATPDGPDEPDETGVGVAELEERESSLATRQAKVEAKQARMRAYQDLANGYTELATTLADGDQDGQAAMQRVVEFEAEEDAPAYFEERTILQVVTESADGGE